MLDQLKRRQLGELLPLLALVGTTPYAIVYLIQLWEQTHYQFFPLVLAATAYLGHLRWAGRPVTGTIHRWISSCLLLMGVGAMLCATAFASPWMGYFAFVLCLGSCLARWQDRGTAGSLLYLVVPVLLVWQPPHTSTTTADAFLIQNLQAVSAGISSRWLDLLGYFHHQPGTILQFADRSFGVEEACSGIQSFFALLAFSAMYVVYFRRPWWFSALLMSTSVFWAILMNTVRISLIPIAYAIFGADLSHGVVHDILGYTTMFIALGMLMSTDEFMRVFLEAFGIRVNDDASHGADAQDVDTSAVSAGPPRRVADWGALRYTVMGLASIAFGGFFALQLYDGTLALADDNTVVNFFRGDVIADFDRELAPQAISGWPQVSYAQYDRDHISDEGRRSDSWTYRAPFGDVWLSLDQPFPGWHELTRCYRNSGWTLTGREVITSDAGDEWPYVVATWENSQGQHGFLAFALFDRNGRVIQPPAEWNQWSSLRERLQNRINPAVRDVLFNAVVLQAQLFVESHRELNANQRQEFLRRYLDVREELRQGVVARVE